MNLLYLGVFIFGCFIYWMLVKEIDFYPNYIKE